MNLLDGDGAGAEVRIERKGTVSGSIFNLCNCMLGVGVLALPSAFSRVGVVLGLVLLFSCAVCVCVRVCACVRARARASRCPATHPSIRAPHAGILT